MTKKVTKKRVIGMAVIIAVIIIPLLYSYLYLGAFWDPYSRLDSMPVAVVNQDQGAVINGKERNVGEELCDHLKEDASLKFIFTEEQSAKDGTNGNDYYAMIVIPEGFSENIASAATTKKQTAVITYSANEKRNYLASQILSRAVLEIEESTRASVNKEIVEQLVDNIKGVPGQISELQDGLGQLKDGSAKLTDGAKSLADGTSEYADKFSEYQSGVERAKDGSTNLSVGAQTLDGGITALLNGANQLAASTADVNQLSDGAKNLAQGASSLNSGLNQYIQGVDSLITSVNTTSEFLTQYVTKVNPAIMKDPVFAGFVSKMSDPGNVQSIKTLQGSSKLLKEASKQISDGATKLSEGSKSLPELKNAIATLAGGLKKAKAGSASLAEGSKSLSGGLSGIQEATNQLSDAAEKMAFGAGELSNGAMELDEGIAKAKDGVDQSIADSKEQISSVDGLAEYVEAPVTIEQDNITSVPNYGTAFAPYFLSLSFWVGALIMFVGIYLDADGKFKILSRDSEHKAARSFLYLVIGLIQAFVLAEALRYGLGLEVANLPLYYAACCLVSITFIAIVQFLMVHLKDLGKFLSILLLILQLTSCGGTFPMETVPKFFNVLYPFMPMTYTVGLFKQAISGVRQSDALRDAVTLGAILITFMMLTVLLSVVKGRRAARLEGEPLTQA